MFSALENENREKRWQSFSFIWAYISFTKITFFQFKWMESDKICGPSWFVHQTVCTRVYSMKFRLTQSRQRLHILSVSGTMCGELHLIAMNFLKFKEDLTGICSKFLFRKFMENWIKIGLTFGARECNSLDTFHFFYS